MGSQQPKYHYPRVFAQDNHGPFYSFIRRGSPNQGKLWVLYTKEWINEGPSPECLVDLVEPPHECYGPNCTTGSFMRLSNNTVIDRDAGFLYTLYIIGIVYPNPLASIYGFACPPAFEGEPGSGLRVEFKAQWQENWYYPIVNNFYADCAGEDEFWENPGARSEFEKNETFYVDLDDHSDTAPTSWESLIDTIPGKNVPANLRELARSNTVKVLGFKQTTADTGPWSFTQEIESGAFWAAMQWNCCSPRNHTGDQEFQGISKRNFAWDEGANWKTPLQIESSDGWKDTGGNLYSPFFTGSPYVPDYWHSHLIELIL